MDLSPYEEAAARYAPARTRVLFVAESPPAALHRYFYYPDVREHDHLWLGLMKALYPTEFGEASEERTRKHEWLERFQADGYQLIDAVKEPLTGTTRQREAVVREHTDRVVQEVREIGPRQVLLLTATVFRSLLFPLTEAGVFVVAKKLSLTRSSGQRTFHERFRYLVDSGRLRLR